MLHDMLETPQHWANHLKRFSNSVIMSIGKATLRPLRKEGYLLIGTGGAVHNLYRNKWTNMLLYRESLGQEISPESWALDFRQPCEDVVTNNRGPALRKGMIRLMQHPAYREAQATDDH